MNQPLTPSHLLDAIHHASDGILIADAALAPVRRAVLFVNEAFCGISGYAAEEVVGVSPRLLWGPRTEPEVVEALRICLAAGKPFSGTTWAYRKDGREFLLEQHVNPVRTRNGELLYWISILRDVTEAAQRSAELEIARAEASHAQRIDTIGRIASGVAHDFNNVLAVVLTTAAALLEETEDPGLREGIDEIRSAAELGARLTRKMLGLASRRVLPPQPISLNVAVADTVRIIRRLIPEGVRLTTALDPGAPTVMADPGELAQVVLNLVLNARDAVGGMGTVSLGTCQLDTTPRWAVLTVRDSGPGMDPVTARAVMYPDFTLKPHGHGLGLTTVRAVVERLGGRVTLETQPGSGSSFSVALPLIDPPAPSHSPDVAFLPRGQGQRVLVVRHDEVPCAATASILRRAGYSVSRFTSPAEALLSAELGPVRRFEAAVLDEQLPLLPGARLAKRLTDLGALPAGSEVLLGPCDAEHPGPLPPDVAVEDLCRAVAARVQRRPVHE